MSCKTVGLYSRPREQWGLIVSKYDCFYTVSSELVIHFECKPPGSWLLAPGVFKPSCSTPFTLFLHLVSVYQSFQLYFIPKTLSTIPLFSAPFLQLISPVFIHNTALLYIVLLALCGHLQTQRVCRVLHPMSGEDGILVAEVPRGPTRFFSLDFS